MGTPKTSPEPTVFVVDDDPAVRESLRRLVAAVDLPVKVFASAHDFKEAYQPDQPGCLILDIRMPGMSGFDLQQDLAARSINLPVIFITGHGDVSTAVRALKAGAVDFIEKPYHPQELLDCIQQCLEQDTTHRRDEAFHVEIIWRLNTLTPRERDVMRLVVAGAVNRVIAQKLGIVRRTVEVHRARMMYKMQAATVSDLVRMTETARASINT